MKYTYRGLHGTTAVCDLEIFTNNSGRTIVVITELPDNKGASVTNAIENIMNDVIKEFQLDLNNTSFVEHYPSSDNHPEETFDILEFAVNSGVISNPKWTSLRETDVLSLGIREHI